MITQRHLELYREYAGDGDAFVRFAKPEEHALMSRNEWMLIGDLLQDMELLGRELVSDSFAESAKHRLRELCDSDVTITSAQILLINRSAGFGLSGDKVGEFDIA